MSSQRRWLKLWARTVGMPIGMTDDDRPEFKPISQRNVKPCENSMKQCEMDTA